MSVSAAQIQFAAEFVTFLVAAAGLALVVLSAELTTNAWWAKLTLAIGFLAMGVGAFGHGSLLIRDDNASLVHGLRIVGIVSLLAGTLRWRASPVARRLVWLGLAVTAASVAVNAQASSTDTVGYGLLAGGSLAIGAALLIASRRSIAARVAASAAGTLLLVVLVLSVALSAVLSSSAQREELSRLSARARTEAQLASDSFVKEVQTSRYAAAYLEKGAPAALVNLGTNPQPAPADSAAIGDLLNLLHGLYPVGGFAYLLPPGKVIAVSGVDSGLVTVLAGMDLIRQTTCGPVDSGSTVVVGRQLLAVAAFPECLKGQGKPLGLVLRLSPLDETYLDQRHADEPSISLALASVGGLLAKIGDQPAGTALGDLANTVLNTDTSTSKVTASRFVAAEPIQASDKRTIAALLVSAPTSSVVATRERLFRTLFLIALGGTLLALGLAALVGDRITAGLRRLTQAAESIQRGDIGQRASISSDDEVGVLGAAFDSMVGSIEQKTTELQAAADDETRLRNRLEAVVAGMGDALVAVDGLGRITDFNQAAEELTGVSASAARGQPADRVLDLLDEDGLSLGGRLRSPSPARWGVLATLVHPSGDEVAVAVSAGALRGPGNDMVGSVLVLRDLRREREVERMKTEFLSRVGHELRTPLTGIMGYADILLRRDVEPARARLWYEEMLIAAKRLLRIVEMLEFFASSGAGRVLLRPERLEIRALVDSVVASWVGRIPPTHTISRRVARGTPEVLGDRRWLALAIDELVDNAVKFSPDGGKVTVTASPIGPEVNSHRNGRANGIEISVADRGKGMTVDEQATAFGEFVQGDSSDTRRFGGLGLGLSLVQRVVEGHNGTVRCVSTPGKGSIFTVTLPAAPPGRRAVGDERLPPSVRMQR
jgi:two-component system sensor histidine kinase VicK